MIPCQDARADKARLSLDGSNLPIVARIERSSETELVVGRSLPFLRLGTRVRDEAGRTGSIARVSMKIEDGVPQLSVELDYDRISTEPPPAVRARRDDTIGYEMAASRPSVPPPAVVPVRGDATNHDCTLDMALALTPPLPREPEVFVPSLHPMPLPLPEPKLATRRPRWRALTFLATLATLLFAWIRPSALTG